MGKKRTPDTEVFNWQRVTKSRELAEYYAVHWKESQEIPPCLKRLKNPVRTGFFLQEASVKSAGHPQKGWDKAQSI